MSHDEMALEMLHSEIDDDCHEHGFSAADARDAWALGVAVILEAKRRDILREEE